jgi:D-alanyl-D-alanine carboxypeptidase/D-alanyl-D-alanine-endopeptidase (penicillin-binding protein 4)
VEVAGKIRTGPLPGGAPLHVHISSQNPAEIVAGLLLYSNNFIANQLFLAAGAARFGWPATWDKGRAAMDDFYRDTLNLSARQITVVEGSGLSRQNRVTPKAMLTILEAFKPYAHLLPVDKGRRLKSGTLTGVYAYAGYFPRPGGGLDPFVLILNQPRNTRDQVLDLLHAMHRENKE